MTPIEHPAVGDVIHLPANSAAAVGDACDPARRPHVFRFGGISLRVVRQHPDYVVQPFLTVAQARAVMVRGAYHERRAGVPTLRLPDALLRRQAGFGETPLQGLTFQEAETLTQLAGGRLPTEREIDYIWSRLGADRFPTGTWQSWTASPWSPYSYSLAYWDDASHVWRAPRSETHRIGGDRLISCVRFDPAMTRFPCSAEDAVLNRAWIVFDS